MYPFIETLRAVDGQIFNLPYHQLRMEQTCARFFPGRQCVRLEDVLSAVTVGDAVCKLRVLYGEDGVQQVEAVPYRMRKIRKLRLVDGGDITYAFKSADRRQLQCLALQKGDADEVIIVKSERLTDTSYSNIALYDGEHWLTPSHPLLAGTMRQYLIDSKAVQEADIRVGDLPNFEKIALINAMMPLGTCEVTEWEY